MLDNIRLKTIYYLTLLSYAITHSNLKLPEPIKEILVQIVAEEQVKWLQEASFSEVYCYVTYDGITPIADWTDQELVNKFADEPDLYLDNLISNHFTKIFLIHISSIEVLSLLNSFHEDVMLSLRDYLKHNDLQGVDFFQYSLDTPDAM